MDSYETPKEINGDCVSHVLENSVINNTMNSNVATEKKCEDSSNDDKIVLCDNFLIDLLSRDSTKDVTVESCVQKDKTHEECEMILEQKQSSDNSETTEVSVSNIVSSEDKLEIVAEETNLHTAEKEIRKSVEGTVPENELETRLDKVPEKNMESCTHVEESNIEEENHPRPETEIIKEISILETPETDKLKKVPDYRCESESGTDDDSSTCDSSSDDSSSDSDFFQDMCEKSKPKRSPPVKTKGELSLEDLPPIEDLVISISESEMTVIGKIHAVVETQMIIRSLKGMKALDLDSVLFLTHEKPLGRVFEVFGPVNEPFYSVRFNSVEQINEKGFKIGADVFFAPEKSDITTYVFIENLQNQKGSDASWKHNNEPPEAFLDYSDDEQEKNAKRQRRIKNRNQQINSDVPSKRPLLSDNSSNYIPPPKPVSPWNRPQNVSYTISRRNPFETRLPPPPSPSPSVCSFISPVRLQNSYSPSSNQPPRQPPNILYRSSPQMFVSPYQQPPHVFGQVAVLNHLSPALHRPSPLPSPVMSNMPTLVPASPFSPPQNYVNQNFSPRTPVSLAPPQNYFNQTFSPRAPATLSPPQNYFNQTFPPRTPATHNQHMVPDPWLQNRSLNTGNVPTSHPLTVQIPNLSSPPLRMHQFNQSPAVQQYVNIHQNGNFNDPFISENRNFPRVNLQPRFYHR